RMKYQRELAGAHNNLGLLSARAGQAALAEQEYRLSLDWFAKLAAAEPHDSDLARQEARAWENLGVTLLADSRTDQVRDALQKGHRILIGLASDNASPALRQALAKSWNNLGILEQTSDAASAEQSYARARDIFEQLIQQSPDDPELRFGLASSTANLAVLRARGTNPAGAREDFAAACDAFARLAVDFPAIEDYRLQEAQTLTNYALFLRDQHDAAADERLQQAHDLYVGLLAARPAATEVRAGLAAALHAQALSALARDDQAAADDLLSRAVKEQTTVVKAAPQNAGYEHDLALYETAAGRYMLARKQPKEAQFYLLQAVEHESHARELAPTREDVPRALAEEYSLLATAQLELGDLEQAAATAEQLAALAPQDQANLTTAAGLLARCIPLVDRFKASTRPTLAEDCARRAVELLQTVVDRQDGDLQFPDLRTAEEFAPLQNRVDFQKVLDRLTRSTRPEK
ncbi:MAG: hypothetical protein ABUL64_00955, partial [Singulisphaera sp.]